MRSNSPLSEAAPLFEVIQLTREVAQRRMWSDITFTLRDGDILFVRGPSGIGKSLLLRALAYLDPFQGGTLHLRGNTPALTGIPRWRAQVMYVHQQRINFQGTPEGQFAEVRRLASQRGRQHGDLAALTDAMGLEPEVLRQQWSELSGGQAQRVALAMSIALRPAVLLLDEPTSACDQDTTLRVEAVLRSAAEQGTALVWVTHDELQPGRVGGRQLELPSGVLSLVPSTVLFGADDGVGEGVGEDGAQRQRLGEDLV